VAWGLTKRVACATQAARTTGSVRMKGARYEGGREEEKPGRMTGDGLAVYMGLCPSAGFTVVTYHHFGYLHSEDAQS